MAARRSYEVQLGPDPTRGYERTISYGSRAHLCRSRYPDEQLVQVSHWLPALDKYVDEGGLVTLGSLRDQAGIHPAPRPERDRLIEVAARALYEHDEATMLHERCPSWDEVEESSREHYREDLAPVVDALIGHLAGGRR